MASAYSHERNYGRPEQPYNWNLINQTAAIKQGRYDANQLKLETAATRIANIDLIRAEDRALLNESLRATVDVLMNPSGYDLSNSRVTQGIISTIEQAQTDYIVDQHINTRKIRAFQEDINRRKKDKDGKYSAINEMYSYDKYGINAYLKGDDDALSKNLQYHEYVDLNELIDKDLLDAYKQSEQALSEGIGTGVVLNKYKGFTRDEMENMIYAKLGSKGLQQLKINAYGNYQTTDAGLKSANAQFDAYTSSRIKDYDAKINATKSEAERKRYQNRKAAYEKEISRYTDPISKSEYLTAQNLINGAYASYHKRLVDVVIREKNVGIQLKQAIENLKKSLKDGEYKDETSKVTRQQIGDPAITIDNPEDYLEGLKEEAVDYLMTNYSSVTTLSEDEKNKLKGEGISLDDKESIIRYKVKQLGGLKKLTNVEAAFMAAYVLKFSKADNTLKDNYRGIINEHYGIETDSNGKVTTKQMRLAKEKLTTAALDKALNNAQKRTLRKISPSTYEARGLKVLKAKYLENYIDLMKDKDRPNRAVDLEGVKMQLRHLYGDDIFNTKGDIQFKRVKREGRAEPIDMRGKGRRKFQYTESKINTQNAEFNSDFNLINNLETEGNWYNSFDNDWDLRNLGVGKTLTQSKTKKLTLDANLRAGVKSASSEFQYIVAPDHLSSDKKSKFSTKFNSMLQGWVGNASDNNNKVRIKQANGDWVKISEGFEAKDISKLQEEVSETGGYNNGYVIRKLNSEDSGYEDMKGHLLFIKGGITIAIPQDLVVKNLGEFSYFTKESLDKLRNIDTQIIHNTKIEVNRNRDVNIDNYDKYVYDLSNSSNLTDRSSAKNMTLYGGGSFVAYDNSSGNSKEALINNSKATEAIVNGRKYIGGNLNSNKNNVKNWLISKQTETNAKEIETTWHTITNNINQVVSLTNNITPIIEFSKDNGRYSVTLQNENTGKEMSYIIPVNIENYANIETVNKLMDEDVKLAYLDKRAFISKTLVDIIGNQIKNDEFKETTIKDFLTPSN